MNETCVKRSPRGITCGNVAVIKIDGQLLCVLHAKEAETKKKGRKGGR